MKRATTIAAALATLGFLAPPLQPPLEAQVRVALQQVRPVETVYVSDFSPYNVGQQPDFLAITIQNGAAESQQVVLEFTAAREGASGGLIFTGRTEPFVLSGPMLRLTNRDLASEGRPHSIVDFEIGSAGDVVTDRIARSGRFPAGTYVFTVAIFTPQGMLLDRAELRKDLTNVTRVELITPGQPFGDSPPVVNSPTPRFVWSTDAGATGDEGEYELRVVQVDGSASGEEAMDGFAAWETTTRSTTALYPGSVSALPLEPGRTYAWQVVRRIDTSGGAEALESPIYWFRMSRRAATGTGEISAGNVGGSRVLARLGRALGLGDDLEGFEPTGRITVDGRPVPIQDLERLLQAILSGEIAVSSVRIR